MICTNCNKIIDDNSIFCIYCQTPTHVAPGFNVLEDDILPELLEQDNQTKDNKRVISYSQILDDQMQNQATQEEEYHKEDLRKKMPPKKKSHTAVILIIVAVIIVVIAICGLIFLNSYTYTTMQAASEYKNEQYEKALSLYQKALEKNPDGVDALVGISADLFALQQYADAIPYLLHALEVDAKNDIAYTLLLNAYMALNDTEGLNAAKELAVTDALRSILDEIYTPMPIFSLEGGTYTEDISIEISDYDNHPIYYTVDGSDPKSGSGILYTEPIAITSGDTTVRAVCKSQTGFSEENAQTYSINYEAPPYPNVSPMNGTFTEPTMITISSSTPGATIYYTWDGSAPTQNSMRYTGPIPVEEGNNILSVIVIDEHNMSSDVLQCNYTYYPPAL